MQPKKTVTTMKNKLIIIGAGGCAKSVYSSISKTKFDLIGFIDEEKTGTFLGRPIFNNLKSIPGYKAHSYFIAIGDVNARERWYETLMSQGLSLVNIIDETAIISNFAKIGVGNFFGKFSIVNADAIIGNNNLINTKALIEHGCKIRNHTNISTNVTLNGGVTVENCAFVGSGAVCICSLAIGEYAVVGAGAVITKDVKPDTTVAGVPAKILYEKGAKI